MDAGRIELRDASAARPLVSGSVPAYDIQVLGNVGDASAPREATEAERKAMETALALLEAISEAGPAEYRDSHKKLTALALALNAVTTFLGVQRR